MLTRILLKKEWVDVFIAKRYVKTNSKYMNDYDSSGESKFIVYLDANSLYGWSMSQYLPYGGFEWLSKEKIKNFNVNSINENSSTGYLSEVELKYTDKLHVFHNDYSLVPENFEISSDMLSNYYRRIADNYKIEVGHVNKLVPNLGNML